MQSPTTTDQDASAASLAPARKVITEPDFSGTPQLIAEWTGRADFPRCALGAYVNIHGFAGVVVEIINQSIKVLAPDGTAQRFNANRLKTLFAPPDHSEPPPERRAMERPQPVPAASVPAEEPEPAAPARTRIADPDFTAPLRVIRAYAGEADFPECALGRHVDIAGYAGVVVEIVDGSLKVQSEAGITRSYNGAVLKKLYGRA